MIHLSAAPNWMKPITAAQEQMEAAREVQATVSSRPDFFRTKLFTPPGGSTTRGTPPPEVDAAWQAVSAAMKVAVGPKSQGRAPLTQARNNLGAALRQLRAGRTNAAVNSIGRALGAANKAYSVSGIDVRSAISAAQRAVTDTPDAGAPDTGAGGGRTALYVGGAGALALLAWKFLL